MASFFFGGWKDRIRLTTISAAVDVISIPSPGQVAIVVCNVEVQVEDNIDLGIIFVTGATSANIALRVVANVDASLSEATTGLGERDKGQNHGNQDEDEVIVLHI